MLGFEMVLTIHLTEHEAEQNTGCRRQKLFLFRRRFVFNY
jgi:hypothetical protein